jgi:hypothetical protein
MIAPEPAGDGFDHHLLVISQLDGGFQVTNIRQNFYFVGERNRSKDNQAHFRTRCCAYLLAWLLLSSSISNFPDVSLS